jgi:hypothetical protein
MATLSNSSVSRQPGTLLRRLLFVFTALTGIELGAGLFVTRIVFPMWASSPEAAIGWTIGSPRYIEEGDFFMFTSPLLALLAISTMIAGWRAAPPLRLWLRIATITFFAIFIWTVAYFIPFQALVKGDPGKQYPTSELSSMLQWFVGLNYIRQIFLVLAFGAALHALGLSYRMADVRQREM